MLCDGKNNCYIFTDIDSLQFRYLINKYKSKYLIKNCIKINDAVTQYRIE